MIVIILILLEIIQLYLETRPYTRLPKSHEVSGAFGQEP